MTDKDKAWPPEGFMRPSGAPDYAFYYATDHDRGANFLTTRKVSKGEVLSLNFDVGVQRRREAHVELEETMMRIRAAKPTDREVELSEFLERQIRGLEWGTEDIPDLADMIAVHLAQWRAWKGPQG